MIEYILEDLTEFILSADSKALATRGSELNVIPVSTVKIRDNTIILVDYFMDKTIKNLAFSKAALVVWTGTEGYQFKCDTDYLISGELYDEIADETKITFPKRHVKGIIVLKPYHIYDISVPCLW